MRPYDHSPADHALLAALYAANGLACPPPSGLPRIGFLAPGVAAGFLYLTDAPAVALCEGFVTNPAAPSGERHDALEAICGALHAAARADGRRLVQMAFRDPGIAARVESWGAAARGPTSPTRRRVEPARATRPVISTRPRSRYETLTGIR